jgi:hypothetical protein
VKLAASLAGVGQTSSDKLAKLRTSGVAVLAQIDASLNTKLDDATKRAMTKLRELLQARGTQLM